MVIDLKKDPVPCIWFCMWCGLFWYGRSRPGTHKIALTLKGLITEACADEQRRAYEYFDVHLGFTPMPARFTDKMKIEVPYNELPKIADMLLIIPFMFSPSTFVTKWWTLRAMQKMWGT